MKKTKAVLIVGALLTLFVVSSFAVQPTKVESADPFFTIVAKTNSGGVRPDYLNFLKQQVARIGINVDVVVQDWPTFVYELIFYRDFDVCYVSLQGGGADPDFTGVYNENGSLNLFGYHTSMDYNETLGTGLNEWYMKQGNLIMPPDSEERVQHYWAWEQYLMDKILPCMPSFAPKAYNAYWSNLKGYNISDGFLQSWGKMYFEGTHDGQSSTSEFVITDAAWSDLNPLFQDDGSSSLISTATMDPLIWYDADLTAWPHLATEWTMINDTHVRINLREDIKWQTDPDGIFTDEYFNAEDVYFTLYSWMTVSNDVENWDWIKHLEIIDEYTIDVFIDGDATTPENEPFAPFLPSLATRILPEHYLNQTQLSDGITPDISDPTWNKFATQCFGTGILEFTSFTEGVETTLQVFADCWRMDTTVTSDPDLDWTNRFGDVWSLQTLRIRIIPDRQTAILEFEAGKTDLEAITDFPERRPEFIADSDFEVQSDTTFSFGFFGFNMRESRGNPIGSMEPCENDPSLTTGLAVRKAIAYALDRNEINNVIHNGEYTITDHPIYQKQGIWCNPNIVRYNYDLDKAREYMIKAGFEIDLPEQSESIVSTTPAFGFWITMASVLTVTSVSIILRKKFKK